MANENYRARDMSRGDLILRNGTDTGECVAGLFACDIVFRGMKPAAGREERCQ
jgi:hypothetical protein